MNDDTSGSSPEEKAVNRLTKEELLAEALDLMEDFGTQREAAQHASREDGFGVGVDKSVFSRRLAEAMRKRDVSRVPLTEEERTFHEDWTAEDCIEDLRALQKKFPHSYITRTFYRNETEIADRTWNRYFGTFLEFKRQARLQHSRFVQRMELQIARHASVDRMRELNHVKNDWSESYLRPSSRRWQSALIGTDQHGPRCDPFYRRTFVDTARRLQPEKIILAGDLLDMADFSKHTKDPREFDPMADIWWSHKFLGDLRTASPDSEITLLEGNHEYRFLRLLAESNPAFMVVLDKLHGFTIPKLLGLDRFDVNFVARADLTAFNERDMKTQLRKNYQVFWRCLLVGHYPDMRGMGIPGANGHHHRHVVWSDYSPRYGPMEWHQLGGGHTREASYCPGEQWGNGFALAHVDTHRERTQFEYVDVSHEAAVIGGQFYERTQDEPVLDLLE